MMDRLDAMAMFVAAIDEGSLAKAARKIGRSPASISRAITSLEARAGERLLHRSTRHLKLTEVGVGQVEIYRQVLLKLAGLDKSAPDLGGTLALTAPELFERMKVQPILENFLLQHSEVSGRLLMCNRVIDLVQEGVDAAVRIASLPNSSMAAVKLGTLQRLVCASPDYLAWAGEPAEPDDLSNHACLNLDVGDGYEAWRFEAGTGLRRRPRTTNVGSRLTVDSAAAAIDAALRGQGICHPLSYQVIDELRVGRLVRLLQSYEPAPVPVHLVFHANPRRGGLVRSFVDYATPILRSELAEVANLLAQAQGAKSGGRSHGAGRTRAQTALGQQAVPTAATNLTGVT